MHWTNLRLILHHPDDPPTDQGKMQDRLLMSRPEREKAQRDAEAKVAEAKSAEDENRLTIRIKGAEDEDKPPVENEDKPPAEVEDENEETPPAKDEVKPEEDASKGEDEKKEDEDEEEDSEVKFYRKQNEALRVRFAARGVADVQDEETPPEDKPSEDKPPEAKDKPDKSDKQETNLLVEVPADTISTLAQDGDWEGITKVFNEQFNSVLQVAIEQATRKIVGIVDNRISERNELDDLWSSFFSTHPALKAISGIARREAAELEQRRLRAGKDANPSKVLDEVAEMLNPLVEQYKAPADKPPRNRRPKAGSTVPTDKKPDKAETQSRQAKIQDRVMHTKARR